MNEEKNRDYIVVDGKTVYMKGNAETATFSSCMKMVYGRMATALGISTIIAWMIGNTEAGVSLLQFPLSFPMVMIAEVVLVMLLGYRINKLSASTAWTMFIVYSILNGITLSVVFLAYLKSSIVSTFGVTALTFGALALFGTKTSKNLSVMGQAAGMALWGLIIASLVNIFLHNEAIYWISSYAGVLIFALLTAWDAQKIKRMFEYSNVQDAEVLKKVAIIGALQLYLDFVNLFLHLLSIMGKRK